MLTTRKSTGFTIIELLVVIVVIAILASITLVSYSGIQQRAKVASVKSELRNMGQSMQIIAVEKDIEQSDWTEVLKQTGLYDATRVSTEKSFVLCWSGRDFAILAMRPLIDSSQTIATGTNVLVFSKGSSTDISWNNSATGSQTQIKACNQVLPGSTSQWSSFV